MGSKVSLGDAGRSLEKGQERQVVVQAGGLWGCDLRPSRVFVWLGRDRERTQRIVSFDRAPRVLRRPRRRRSWHIAGVDITFLGNPLVTAALTFSAWLQARRRTRGRR